ncbi:autotransporter outer membrane beta-barrel domain-containing protein [Methylomonas sp. AM2-LC]|uniref:autotransporter outer membrane beta-barrel domain-containing protein n=1 Tax=Methylomonas sp. AM2-LC TaxID=3153301 RepID=UPI00326323A6
MLFFTASRAQGQALAYFDGQLITSPNLDSLLSQSEGSFDLKVVNTSTGNYVTFTETVTNSDIFNGSTAALAADVKALLNSRTPVTIDGLSLSVNCYNSSNVQIGSNFNSCFDLVGTGSKEQQTTNALTSATTVNLQLNRTTTEISNSLQSMRTLRDNPGTSKQGAGAGDVYELMGPIGLFFNAGGTFGTINSTNTLAGYHTYTRNFNTGLDYKINERLVTGLLFGYTSSAVNVGDNGGSFDANIFRVSPYFSLSPTDDTYVDFSVGYAHHDNNSQRNCLFCLSSATANFGTEEYNILTGLGYTHSFGALSLRGYGQASSIYMDIGGYSESGTALTGLLNVSNQHVLSITSTFGTELSYSTSMPFGVVIPRVFGEWVREYANDTRQVQAVIQGGGSTTISAGAIGKDWANLGAGVQMVLPNGLSSLINYRSMVMQGAVNHSIEGTLRLEF